MTFSEILLAIGNAIRAGNPKAIAFLIVTVLCIFALLFGIGPLMNLLRILLPFWLPVLLYWGFYLVARAYKQRHPEFVDEKLAAAGATGVVLIILIAMST